MLLILLFAAVTAVLLLAVCRKRRTSAKISAFLSWALLLILCGIPFVRNGGSRIRIPFLVLSSCAFLLILAFCEEGKKRDRLFLISLLACSFSLYAFWALITKRADAPDEEMHFVIVRYITRTGLLPSGDNPNVRDSIWGFSYAYYPILPYMIGGYIGFVLKRFIEIKSVLIYIARFVNVCAGTATVYFVWKISGNLFGDHPVRFLLPVMTAFFPEFAFINTYINTDAFAMLSSAMIIWSWTEGIRNGWGKKEAVRLAVSMAVCMLSYYYYYGFLLLSIPLCLITARQQGKSGKEIIKLALLTAAVAFAFAGWWFIRNAVLYDGDFLGRRTLNADAELYAWDSYKPSQISNPRKEGESIFRMIFEDGWLRKTLKSFVAMYSGYSLEARHYLYQSYKVLFGCSAFGAVFGFVRRTIGLNRRKRNEKEQTRTLAWILVFAILIPFILAGWYSYNADYQPQGRYVLGCLIPLMIFVTYGIRSLMELLIPRNEKANMRMEAVTLVLLEADAALTLNSFLDVVFTYYVH